MPKQRNKMTIKICKDGTVLINTHPFTANAHYNNLDDVEILDHRNNSMVNALCHEDEHPAQAQVNLPVTPVEDHLDGLASVSDLQGVSNG